VKITRPTSTELLAALANDERILEFPYAQNQTVTAVELRDAAAPDRGDANGLAAEPEPRILPGDITPSPAPSDLEGLRQLYARLDRLRKATKTLSEEQGVHTLYVALGWLEWRETAETQVVRSPLVLVPVEIRKEKQRYRLAPHDDDVEHNVALQIRFQQDFNITIPDLSLFEHEEQGLDLDGYLREVSAAVSARGWTVTSEAWLAQFASYKLPMYRDLGDDVAAQLTATQGFLSVLCGLAQPFADQPCDIAAADAHFSSRDGFTVLPADASQLEVLEAVRQGESLVVQGPPGTGKSQTIVNIIADALRRGQRVLFVSEKRAALDVVYRRLKELGLDTLCLDLHSHRGNRKTVLADLMAAVTERPGVQRGAHLQEFEALRETRQRLDAYVHALWERRGEMQRTAYQVHGRLARLAGTPDIRAPLPASSIVDLPAVTERQWRQAIDDVVATGIWDQIGTHPFRHAEPTLPRVWLAADVQHLANRLVAAVPALSAAGESVSQAVGLTPPPTFGGAVRLKDAIGYLADRPVAQIPAGWFSRSADVRATDRALIEEGTVRQEALAGARRWLRTQGAGELPERLAAVRPLLLRLTEIRQRRGLARWRFRFEARRGLHRLGARIRFGSAVRVLESLEQLEDDLRWFTEHDGMFREALGTLYRGQESDFPAAQAALSWLDGLSQYLEVTPSLIAGLAEGSVSFSSTTLGEVQRSFDERLRAAHEAIAGVDPLFPAGIDGQPLADVSLPTLADLATTWAHAPGELSDWFSFRRARGACEALGLGDFVREARAMAVPAAALAASFEHTILRQWVREVYQSNPALAEFNASTHESLIAQFRDLDRRLHRAAIQDVVHAVRERIPRPLPSREEQRLRQEAVRRRRLWPLRRLLPAIPNVLLANKPCLMMSPLSVAVYLPKELFRFDLVVFDEASQLPPGDAVGAILRGRQTVILGDNKQLPPTDFFRAYADEEDEAGEDEPADDVSGFESVLDIATTALPNRSLLWHYRSLDERLIAFSNVWFYGRRLITFPVAYPEDDLGVRFVHVSDGVWARGGSRTNLREADRVADLVLEHLEQRPQFSLGVVAMNLAQADLIERQVQVRLQTRPELAPHVAEERDEPFFVKNLETVQGDERDEMIIGIGYGPTAPGGTPTLQFGPLNRVGGERRWNVAITRARRRSTLVASMLPHQLDGVRASARDGPKAMRDYMSYAQHGGAFETEALGQGEPESDFEIAVRDALVRRDFTVNCQVGTSGFRVDLAVCHPDYPSRYILGIECDGAMYHRAKTTRDRDSLRQQILEERGWNIHRVWSTDWIANPDRALAKIEERINALRRSPQIGVARSPTRESIGGNGDSITASPSSARLAGETAMFSWSEPVAQAEIRFAPYVVYDPRDFPSPRFLSSAERNAVARHVARLVQTEGPVHRLVALNRLLSLSGRRRHGGRITPFLDGCISHAVQSRQIREQSFFLYPTESAPVTPRLTTGDQARSPERIAPEEWDAAVTSVLERLGASEPDVLERAVVAAFGYDHMTAPAREAVQGAINRQQSRYRIKQYDGLWHLG